MSKSVRAHIPNATYQVPWPLAFWFQSRGYLKGFYLIWAWWPSWSCDQYNWNKFWLTYHKESSYQIWVQLVWWFLRKLCFNVLMGLPIWATLATKLKVNLDLWNLFIAIVSLVLTYQVKIMTLASTVFKKSTFQKISLLNALGRKFDLYVKKVKVNLGSSFEQTW